MRGTCWWRTTKGRSIIATPGLALLLYTVYSLSLSKRLTPSRECLMAYANNGLLVYEGDWFRLITATLLHHNQQHLMTNLITLLLLGYGVERLIGSGRLLVVYVMAGLFGSIVSASLNQPYVYSTGASGAIMGLFGYLICSKVLNRESVATEVFVWACVMMLANLSWTQGSRTDLFGHFGGFLGGIISVAVVGLPFHVRAQGELRRTALLGGIAVIVMWAIIVTLPLLPFGHSVYSLAQSLYLETSR